MGNGGIPSERLGLTGRRTGRRRKGQSDFGRMTALLFFIFFILFFLFYFQWSCESNVRVSATLNIYMRYK